MQTVFDDQTIAGSCSVQQLNRYLRFLGCPRQAVEDLAQEALLAGLRKWPTGDAPLPWLLAAARNQLRKLLRDQGRNREVVDIERLDRLWVEHVVDCGESMRDALRACLSELPVRSRKVLQQRYGDKLSRAEIGARIGMGDEGIKSMLVRLRSALERCIRQRQERDD